MATQTPQQPTPPTPPTERRSRLRHFRAWISRQARGHRTDTIAILVLGFVGLVMMLGIFTQQKASLPSWLPFVGEEFEHISAQFSTAQAVTPGQGQAVDVSGIQIGKVASVELEDGHAVVGMEIEPKYMKLIHPDAQFLLRPKTGLNDMIVEVEPGTGRGEVEDGHVFPLSQTEPTVQLEALWNSLDADTRQYIQLLVAGGAQGIGGHGVQLGNALRRFEPFVEYSAKLNKAIAGRRTELAKVIHNFGELTTELGKHDAQIRRFVGSSEKALGNFANQQAAVEEAFEQFPETLKVAQEGLASSNEFSTVALPTLTKLIPQAQASTPAFKATERLFRETTAPIGDGIRPFSREIRPLLTHANEASGPFEKTVRSFGESLAGLNSFFNELSFKPKGKQSYLFYVPWINHDFNAALNLEDGGGPVLRSQVMLSCTGAFLGYGTVEQIKAEQVQTLLEMIGAPRAPELPNPFGEPGHCTVNKGGTE
ncbi:MAG TPA: MlaD family protein [Solirubrobacterales bacterium]|jgi:phospholipid/cholesterol/gamma-HCH transport system substrate-binding protein